MRAHPAIRPAAFIRYKFLNSLFLGLSVGAVFVLLPLFGYKRLRRNPWMSNRLRRPSLTF